MEQSDYTIDCWAFFGAVSWDIDKVYAYIDSAKRIYGLFGSKETHYGFSALPYGTVKGSHMGSPKNVAKKVEKVYSVGARMDDLEFFSLPKNYNLQYSEYGIYLARNDDFIVVGYDTSLFPQAPLETILAEMKAQLSPVWGEHFQIRKGQQPFVYCMDQFKKNPCGENLIEDAYVEKLQTIHIIKQFKV